MSYPFCILNLPVLPICMGCPEEMLSFARHTNLFIHNSEKYMFLELFLLSCIPAIFFQLIAKSMCAFVLIDAYYSCGPSSHSIPELLGETNSSTSSISGIGSKQLYSADQNANPAFVLFYLGVLPPYVRIVMGIAPPLMNSGYSDTSHHHYSFLGSVLL